MKSDIANCEAGGDTDCPQESPSMGGDEFSLGLEEEMLFELNSKSKATLINNPDELIEKDDHVEQYLSDENHESENKTKIHSSSDVLALDETNQLLGKTIQNTSGPMRLDTLCKDCRTDPLPGIKIAKSYTKIMADANPCVIETSSRFDNKSNWTQLAPTDDLTEPPASLLSKISFYENVLNPNLNQTSSMPCVVGEQRKFESNKSNAQFEEIRDFPSGEASAEVSIVNQVPQTNGVCSSENDVDPDFFQLSQLGKDECHSELEENQGPPACARVGRSSYKRFAVTGNDIATLDRNISNEQTPLMLSNQLKNILPANSFNSITVIHGSYLNENNKKLADEVMFNISSDDIESNIAFELSSDPYLYEDHPQHLLTTSTGVLKSTKTFTNTDTSNKVLSESSSDIGSSSENFAKDIVPEEVTEPSVTNDKINSESLADISAQKNVSSGDSKVSFVHSSNLDPEHNDNADAENRLKNSNTELETSFQVTRRLSPRHCGKDNEILTSLSPKVLQQPTSSTKFVPQSNDIIVHPKCITKKRALETYETNSSGFDSVLIKSSINTPNQTLQSPSLLKTPIVPSEVTQNTDITNVDFPLGSALSDLSKDSLPSSPPASLQPQTINSTGRRKRGGRKNRRRQKRVAKNLAGCGVLQEDFTSDEDDFTTSEALTATISDDESLFSTALRHRLLQQILLEKHPDFQSQLDQPIEKGIYRYDDSSNKHECFLQTRDQAAATTRVSPKASTVRRLSSEPDTRKAASSTPSTGTNDKDSTPKAESQEPCLRKASSEVKSQGSASPNLNVDQKNVALASTSFPSSMPAQKVSFRLPDSYVETPPNVSDLEDQSSDATETGADVSELRSFAEESAENQASANDGNENDEIQEVVQEIVPELVMPSYKDIPEEGQDNVPEVVMPRYDDIPKVVLDNVPESAMPKYEDIPEVEQDNVPELVMPSYKAIPEVVQDNVPELVMPKYEDVSEVEADKVPEKIMPSFKDIPVAVQIVSPELVMPRYEDTSDAMQENIHESVKPREKNITETVQERVTELIMPSHNDIPEVTIPVDDGYEEPKIKLPISEAPEIDLSCSAMKVPSRECTPEEKMPVYESDGFPAFNIKPALKKSTFDDKSDLKVQAQDSPSELQIKIKTTPALNNTPSDSTPVSKISVAEKLIDEKVQAIDGTDQQFSNNANIAQKILPSDDINSCIPAFKKEDLEPAQDVALLAQATSSIVKQTDVTRSLADDPSRIRSTDVEENVPPNTLHFARTQQAETEKVANVPVFTGENYEIVHSQQSEVNQLVKGLQSTSTISDEATAGTVQTSNIDDAQKLNSDSKNSSCDPTIMMSDTNKSVQDDSFRNSSLIDNQVFSNNLVNNKLYEAMEFSNMVGEVKGNNFNSRNILEKEKEPHQTFIQLKLEKVENELFPKTSPQNLREYDSDSSEADQVAVGTQTSLAFDPPRMLKKKAAEISTQTDEDRALSVMGLNTSWCVDQHGVQSGPVISTPKIRDITLDVMLPSETQALVTQARMGSYSSKDLEDDVSEMGTTPCVITSQISLNIIGLEQNEDTPHSKASLVFQSAAPKQSVCYGLPSASGRNANIPNVEPVKFAKSGAISKKTSTTDLPFNTISVYRHQDIISPRPSPSEISSTNVQEEMSSPLSREWSLAERDFMSSYPNSGIVFSNKTFPTGHSDDFEENRPKSPIPPSADESRHSSSNISSGFFTDRQYEGPQFFSDTPDNLMEYSGWSTDATKPSTSEYMTRSSTDFSDYPDEYFYEFPDYDSSTVLSNDVDTSFVGSMSSLDDDLMEPMYFACSVSYTPSSSVPQTPDQETEIKLACDPELSALADAAIEDDTTLYLPTDSPPTTPTEDRRPHSPQLNEASSLSSKRSSPDMEEYEVIQKDPAKSSSAGQAATAPVPAPQV